MTSLNLEGRGEDVGAQDKENTGKTPWKRFAPLLPPMTPQEEYFPVAPHTVKALQSKCNFDSQPKSLTARNTDKSFFSVPGSDFPKCEPSKCSVKSSGIVKSYAANTNKGLVRNYNEDRVAIILNIVKPVSRSGESWPKCSFFGVYDGHGGSACADFLRDNLHQFIIREATFPSNPREALRRGFEAAEKHFLEFVAAKSKKTVAERSGSCAIVALVVGDACFVANVGDSRAVLSAEAGRKTYPLSSDHKPSDAFEQRRIIEGGGKVYQSQLTQTRSVDGSVISENVLGPFRVLPGRLSVRFTQVSRTFGDTEAKLPRFGGNSNVIIAVPDIKSFRISSDHDFILMASDGVFDKMTNREVVQVAWETVRSSTVEDVHQASGKVAEAVLKSALGRQSLDNVTVVVIGFSGLWGSVSAHFDGRLPVSAP